MEYNKHCGICKHLYFVYQKYINDTNSNINTNTKTNTNSN